MNLHISSPKLDLKPSFSLTQSMEIEPSQNSFETVLVDVTHRCNMTCANCYLPNRDVPDMDIIKLQACLEQFPKRTNIRIAGAEPTMRKDLPDIIAMVRKSGHRAVLLTNGLRLARESYVDELYHAGLRHVYISLNGVDNDDWYKKIDQLACADKKLTALKNIVARNMILNTGTIIVRGVNEGAVRRLYQIIQELNPRHALMRFKNVGALGRYDQSAEQQNLTMLELENLAANAIGKNAADISSFNRFKGDIETNTRLFPSDLKSQTGRGIWFKLANWQADDQGLLDANSKRRGRITQDFKIAPFFEHVKANEGEW